MSTTLPEQRVEEPAAPTAAAMPPFPAAETAVAVAVRGKRRRRQLLVAGLVAGALVCFFAIWIILNSLRAAEQALIFYTVTRGDLPIVVTERGNLESQQNTEIRCEVENLTYDRSGNSGTQILFIVPNGKPVKEGELLVELDSAPLREKLDEQYLDTEQARASKIQAVVKYDNQKTQNETLLREAELKVQLAELELQMYRDPSNGTYHITRKELELKIQEAKNSIAEALAALAMQKTDRDGIEMLYTLGYRAKGDREQAIYRYLQAEDRLVAAKNSLVKANADLKKLDKYESPMELARLTGALETAKRNLEQVKRDNEALLAQAEAAKIAATKALEKEQEQLEKYKTQLEKCKIYAPHDGMVVYAVENRRYSSTSTIAEGAFVRERQKILELPDLSRMQVKTTVHESVLDQVHAGLPAVIKVDAFPDRSYRGTVKSVAVLPEQGGWLSSDIKVYETIVTIDEEVSELKPGMTAVVEIHIDRLHEVLSVPVQAVVQIDNESWCYVDAPRGVERRQVRLGRSNDKFVEIRSGLQPGERVVLNPMALVEQEQSKQEQISPEKGVSKAAGSGGPNQTKKAGQQPASKPAPPERPKRARTKRAGQLGGTKSKPAKAKQPAPAAGSS